MGVIDNVGTSFRLTGASLRMVFRNPVMLVIPLFTLLAVGAWVVGPINFFIWQSKNDPANFQAFWGWVYSIPLSMAKAGNFQGAIPMFVTISYIVWAVWMTVALTFVLFFTTVGMDLATQLIRTRKMSLGAAFGVASRNLHRVFLMALFTATFLAIVRRAMFFTRMVPVVGWLIRRAVNGLLLAVNYVMLPIIIYERAGPVNAFKSAWRNVKTTWSGLAIGVGTMGVATYVLFAFFVHGLFQGAIGLDPESTLIIDVIVGGLVFALFSSAAAAMRACLYWYATTGEVPEGFEPSYLPTITSRGPITAIGAAGMVMAPSVQAAPPTFAPTPVVEPTAAPKAPATRASTKSAPAKSGGTTKAKTAGARRLTCPKCKTVNSFKAGAAPICGNCGFGG